MLDLNYYFSTKRYLFFKLIILVLLVITVKYHLDNKFLKEKVFFLQKTYSIQIENLKNAKNDKLFENEPKPNVYKFDLNQALEPSSVYEPIQCRKSSPIYVSTTLCVHNLENDKFVSDSIWRNGVWEGDIVRNFMDYLNQNPDWLVFDVGAQIGQYSLYAAKLDRQVVTVEPFHDNIVRIHKASVQESLQNKITLIKNAISNKRNEVKMLAPNPINIGGQSLLGNDKVYSKDPNNKYLVETILFDDLIPFLPKNNQSKDYEKALMKIDIEGFEPFAFQNASNLFKKIDFQVIFMEWGNLPAQRDNHNLIVEMMNFLYNLKFKAYSGHSELNREQWLNWPMDIVWKKV